MTRCHAAPDGRMILHRHEDDCDRRHCRGCQPCTLAHCGTCGGRHVGEGDQTCPECVGQARRTLAIILDLVAMAEERLDGWPARSPSAPQEGPRGTEAPLPGGELMVLVSGGSEGSSSYGRTDPANSMEHGDPPSVLWSLVSWETVWREERGDEPGAWPAVLTQTKDYLDANLAWAAQHHPAFNEFAGDIRRLRQRLETALRDGPQLSPVPCITCGRRALERPDVRVGSIEWRCGGCHTTYTEAEFWQAVRAQGEPV